MPYICPICKAVNDDDAKYCKNCGKWLLDTIAPPLAVPKRSFWKKIPGFRSGKLWKKIIAFIFYALLLLFFIGVITSNDSSVPSSTSSLTTSEIILESPEQFKSSCETVSYDSLARNTEQYVNKRVVFTGQVVQVIERGNNFFMRINVTQKGSAEFPFWDDTLLVSYTRSKDESRILEGDIVQFWGIVKGRTTYTTIFGQEITLPEIIAKYIDIIQKATAR